MAVLAKLGSGEWEGEKLDGVMLLRMAPGAGLRGLSEPCPFDYAKHHCPFVIAIAWP